MRRKVKITTVEYAFENRLRVLANELIAAQAQVMSVGVVNQETQADVYLAISALLGSKPWITGYSVILDATNNPPSNVDLGYIDSDIWFSTATNHHVDISIRGTHVNVNYKLLAK
jgi:hypothetical protein